MWFCFAFNSLLFYDKIPGFKNNLLSRDLYASTCERIHCNYTLWLKNIDLNFLKYSYFHCSQVSYGGTDITKNENILMLNINLKFYIWWPVNCEDSKFILISDPMFNVRVSIVIYHYYTFHNPLYQRKCKLCIDISNHAYLLFTFIFSLLLRSTITVMYTRNCL